MDKLEYSISCNTEVLDVKTTLIGFKLRVHYFILNKDGKVARRNIKNELSKDIFNDKKIKIIQMASGRSHILFLDERGSVFGLLTPNGHSNTYGQLGVERQIHNKEVLIKITKLPKIKKICCGAYYSFCLDINDKLWGFGRNDYFQIGLDRNSQYLPVLLKEGVLDVFASRYHDLAFLTNVGNNDVLLLGKMSYGDTLKAYEKVESLKGKGKILKMETNRESSFILFANGDIYYTYLWNYVAKGNLNYTKLSLKTKILDFIKPSVWVYWFLDELGDIFYISPYTDLEIDLKKQDGGFIPLHKLEKIPKEIKNNPMNWKFSKSEKGRHIILMIKKLRKKKIEMKKCSHCKKKITVGKEFNYKRKKEKFFFHFECLKELSEDYKEEIKDKMKKDLY